MTGAARFHDLDPVDLEGIRTALRAADPEGRLAPIRLRQVLIGPDTLLALPAVVAEMARGRRVVLVMDRTPMRRGGRDLKSDVAGLLRERFKDVGLPFDQLRTLAAAIRADGRRVMLEVVSERREDELRSARAALDLGVDYLLGGTHAADVARLIAGSPLRYFPFPGTVVGHPSLLRGTIQEITDGARRLGATAGVHGLDLLAYRYDGDVEALVRGVIAATSVPVIAAGSISTVDQIRRLTELGVWGFTVGTAIFERRFAPDDPSFEAQVRIVLGASAGDQAPAFA